MKVKIVIIILIILFSSIYTAGASSQVSINSSKGKITGRIETQGRCIPVAVTDLKVACGRSLKNYEIDVTDDFGCFKFDNLTFEDTGSKYYVWILPFQRVIFQGIKSTILDENTPEEDIYLFILFWGPRIFSTIDFLPFR